MPCERATQTGQLPQNRREDKVRRCEVMRRTDPLPTTSSRMNPPMHQLGTGSNRDGRSFTDVIECRPTIEQELLRKEVIQPHLPVRLPCYDFTPITDPTFDGSSPCGLGHRLRVLPTFVV